MPDIEYNEIDILIIIVVTARTYSGIHYLPRISYVNNSHWKSSSSITLDDGSGQLTFTSQPCNGSVACRATETWDTHKSRCTQMLIWFDDFGNAFKGAFDSFDQICNLLTYGVIAIIDGMSSIYLCNRAQSLFENVQMIGWFNRIIDGDAKRAKSNIKWIPFSSNG